MNHAAPISSELDVEIAIRAEQCFNLANTRDEASPRIRHVVRDCPSGDLQEFAVNAPCHRVGASGCILAPYSLFSFQRSVDLLKVASAAASEFGFTGSGPVFAFEPVAQSVPRIRRIGN